MGFYVPHVLVNDGKRHGIATLGRPFTIGATSFDLTYGQGFYGWIGDIRVSSKALRPWKPFGASCRS